MIRLYRLPPEKHSREVGRDLRCAPSLRPRRGDRRTDQGRLCISQDQERKVADLRPGGLVTQYEERPIARELIHRGYNFVSMDLRGTGASFGAEFSDSWRAGHDIA